MSTTPASGWTCPNCRAFVPIGQTHSCSKWVNPPLPQQPELVRIATALERIAAALEKERPA